MNKIVLQPDFSPEFFSYYKYDDYILFKIRSEKFDLFATSILSKQIVQILENWNLNVIFDLSETEYIDSTGFGFLLNIYDTLGKKNKKLLIVSPSSKMHYYFDLLEISNLISLYDSLGKALKSLSA